MITQVAIAVAILVLGIPLAKIIEGIVVSLPRKKNGAKLEKPAIGTIAFHAAMTIILVVTLGYINININFEVILEHVNVLSDALSIIIVISCTIVLTRLLMMIL